MKSTVYNYYNKLKATNILSNFFNLTSIQVSNVLLLLLTVRIITVRFGFEGMGLIMFAYRFSMFAGTFVNYGTSQSAVRDTAYNLTDIKALSAVFYNALFIRSTIFLLFFAGLLSFHRLYSDIFMYLLLSVPVVFAEVLNPLPFLIGIEKTKLLNIYNLLSNIVAVFIIYLFIQKGNETWVNFTLGIGNIVTYLGLLIYIHKHLNLSFCFPSKDELKKLTSSNFSLTINNLSANLQQSIIIFALKWANSDLLGAYSLCDRVIGQCRNMFNIIINAIYPKAVALYKEAIPHWDIFRKKMKYIFSLLALGGAVIIFILAGFITYILSKVYDTNTILILRIMAFVPVISAMNVFSILDMILNQKSRGIFNIAISLLVIAVAAAFMLVNTGNTILIGSFTLIVEGAGWLMYEYVIKKPALQNA